MAPVKRAAASAQRETRSTRASAVVKKAAAPFTKKVASPATKKRVTATAAATGTVTRRTRRNGYEETIEELLSESEAEKDVEAVEAKSLRGRPGKNVLTKTTAIKPDAPARGLAAAPRRRIKITPLNPIIEPVAKDETKSSESKTKPPTAVKKTIKKTRKVDEQIQEDNDDQLEDAAETKIAKPRATRNAAIKLQDEEAAADKKVVVKTRGRPKKAGTQEKIQPKTDEREPAPSRATRTRQASSTVTQQPKPPVATEVSNPSRPTVASRKTVTFQGVSDENDKENQPLLSRTKKLVGSKTDDSGSKTGLRAKPLRKPATSTTKTRGRKVNTNTDLPSDGQDEDATTEKKKMPRALTPKKITQVAKSSIPTEDEDQDMSDGVDELSGDKTPMRDLSVSPRRPLSAALGRAVSPAKKLDFGQDLGIQIASREGDGEVKGPNGSLASPARRAPASPFKDGLKDSPKRGDGMKLLFPTQNQSQTNVHTSLALNPLNITSASQTMSTLLQSPKRNGFLDAGLFSQSAMKQSSTKSPFKASLLASPARRLFSPAKKSATPVMSKISELVCEDQDTESEHEIEQNMNEEVEDDITVSSHFRSANSPLRVHLAENDNGVIDFDDSILQVRSPLKVQKSPLKKISHSPKRNVEEKVTPAHDPDIISREDHQEVAKQHTQEDPQIVDPSNLEDVSDHAETQMTDVEDTAVAEQDSETEIDTTTPPRLENAIDHNSPAAARDISHESEGSGRSVRQLYDAGQSFRNIDLPDDTEISEDELAAEATPVRVLAKKSTGHSTNNKHTRLSTGISHSAAGRNLGFTPLVAQMNGWQAASPEKTPIPQPASIQRHDSFEFSPLAGQHVDGEVMISRNSTPVQKLNLRRSFAPVSSSKSASKSRQSLGLRKSLAQRKSLDPRSHQNFHESPERNAQFEEYMEMRALEEEADAMHEDTEDMDKELHHDHDFDHIMDVETVDEKSDVGDDTILAADYDEEDAVHSAQSAGELTTDLVNFTNASDTAVIDFQKLAQEAEELAPVVCRVEDDEESLVLATHNEQIEEHVAGDVHALPFEEHESSDVDLDQDIGIYSEADANVEEALSPVLRATTSDLNSPSILVINEAQTEARDSQSEDEVTQDSSPVARHSITPARLPQDFSQARMINTVISKIPLKPEGAISPIKVQRKRARSFGNNEGSSNKRISFGNLKEVEVTDNNDIEQSPDRRVRTSAAPSPGGTSTPASRYSRYSFGDDSAFTTPGQMSFVIDDFGDSTLDGIEVPEEYDEDTQIRYDDEEASPAMTERNHDAETSPETPRQAVDATPLASMNGGHQIATPATVTKTPVTVTKKASRKSLNVKSERKPLKPVSSGVLDGVVVFVDVHTSEGADASGIFVELLTQMGARCVKEWRWNSRASLAGASESDDIEQRVGITHVVYKDGGKRTLEKVRDAKGEVLCVGVAWVLDCERQSKWLDEANYAIDISVLPRGGSKRRKSMEPRALLHNGDGSLSSNRSNRRSVSAEMSEMMKQELINTPVRNHHTNSFSKPTNDENEVDEDEDEDHADQATPTGYISYDPRTAMTPGTPYLVSQSKKLIQMSAPPKQQTGKRLFDHDDDDDDEEEEEGKERDQTNLPRHGSSIEGNPDSKNSNESESEAVKKDAKKFRMRNLDSKIRNNRRRTLGFKPVVGSPLAK